MKKSVKLVAALAVVATVMSGCITATVLMSKFASDEKKEILDGKVFQETQGTVYYDVNGISEADTLRFKQNGKYIRIDKHNGDFIIITSTEAIKGNKRDKTYVRKENKNGTYYYSNLSMVFPVEWFRWDKFAEYMIDDTNKSEVEEYIADKKCVSFVDGSNYKVSGYKRIYMSKKEDGDIKFKASRVSQACDAEFKAPKDCREVEGSIDFEERF